MKIQITKRFIDRKNHTAYGPIVYDLKDALAMRLHAEGRGRIVDDAVAQQLDIAKVTQGLPIESPSEVDQGSQARVLRDLPEGFPEREVLIAHGFATIESLMEKGVEMELTKIDGIGKGKLNKIAIALESLK